MRPNETFEQLVAEGIDAIPEKFLEKLENVAIVVEDEPTPEQRRELRLHKGLTLFGLYEGVPMTKRGPHYGEVLPDKITIFKNPILEAARTPQEVRQMVRDTVWHEIAHHFGMNEREVRAKERRRGRIRRQP